MRRPLLLVAGLAAMSVLALRAGVASAPRPASAPPTLRSVSVVIRCPAGRVSARVDPDTVFLVQGDSLQWTLADSSDAREFGIQPQPGGRPWPFADALLPRGGPDRPAGARRMRPAAAGHYRYTVVADCAAGDGTGVHAVRIDPDLIIRNQ